MNLEECYEVMDSDYDDVMRRLGSETLVRKFVLKFLDDTSFQGLKEGLENQDAELAFRSAHTLKGVCMNLGFTKLFEVSSALTEELRDREIKENTTEMFEEVEREYTRIYLLAVFIVAPLAAYTPSARPVSTETTGFLYVFMINSFNAFVYYILSNHIMEKMYRNQEKSL